MNNLTLCPFGLNPGKNYYEFDFFRDIGDLILSAIPLGCKRSWVQIPPVRPFLNIEITHIFTWKTDFLERHCFAYFYGILSQFMAFIRGRSGESSISASNATGGYVARINIEDDFFDDAVGVIAAVGDVDKVYGNALRFFRYAQSRHKKGRLITEDEFKSMGFLEALIPVFAKRTPSGIQAAGAKKHFKWLEQKIESGRLGGQVSAKRPRDAKGRLQKLSPQLDFSPSEHQPSYSSSLSYSSSSSDSLKNPTDSTKKAKAFIAGYCERFKTRYGHNPEVLGKQAGIAKRISKTLSEEKVGLYLDAFFSIPDSWLVKSKHPLELFENKFNEIVVFANSGAFTTKREANQADASVALHTQLEQIRRGEIG